MPAAYTVDQILRRTGGRLTGHFVFTSGLHAPEYVNVRVLREPENRKDLETVAWLMAYATRSCQPQCVVVPASADQWLGPAVSAALEELVYHMVPCVGAAKVRDDSGKVTALSIADADIEKVRNKRVLVIDDTASTGGSVKLAIEEAQVVGGEVVMVAVVVNRGNVTFGFPPAQEVSLLKLDLVAYPPDECPLCEQDVPINTDVGHGAAYLQKLAEL